MLISQLLGRVQVGLSSACGDTPLAGSDTLNSLAVQTLSHGHGQPRGFGNREDAGPPARTQPESGEVN